MIIEQGVKALVAIGNKEELAEVVDALAEVGLLVGGYQDALLRPQRGELDRGVPSAEGVEAELMPPGRGADCLRPVERLGWTSCHRGVVYCMVGEGRESM